MYDLILASGSPRRKMLLSQAGYSFRVVKPDPGVESGRCSGETAAELVLRYAVLKAADVAKRIDNGFVVAADTVADCQAQILGKPANEDHARDMLKLLSGSTHSVFTGLCLWNVEARQYCTTVCQTTLIMNQLTSFEVEDYIESGLWEGKAGGFGYQDGNDWLQIHSGSESNVVGLPMERFEEMLSQFDSIARPVPDGM